MTVPIQQPKLLCSTHSGVMCHRVTRRVSAAPPEALRRSASDLDRFFNVGNGVKVERTSQAVR